jgi:hypothetical protein
MLKVLSRMLVPLHHAPENRDRERGQICRKASQDSQSVPEEELLLVHLLKALTFPPEFKNPIIINISAGARMIFAELLKCCEKAIADINHFLPSRRNSPHVLFTTHAQNSGFIEEHQFCFELSGFVMKRCAKIVRKGRYPAIKISKRRPAKFLKI